MKRRLYYTLLIVITASCMLYGTFRHILRLSGLADEGEDDYSNIMLEDGSGEFNQQLNPFTSILADVDVCSITILHGDSYRISGHYVKDMKSDFGVEDGVLTIRQNEDNTEHVLGVRRDDNGIVITIPEEETLERIDLTSSVATITIHEIDAVRCHISNQTGDLSITGMETEYAMIRVDAGNVEMADVDFDRLHVRTGVSEVRLSTGRELGDYRISLSTEAGSVNYGGSEQRNAYRKENDTGKVLEITNGTGNVLVSYRVK